MALNLILLGKRVKKLRKKKGISQETLSEIINTTPTYVSYIENGYRCMSLETLVILANALNVSADELLIDSLDNTIRVSNYEFSLLLDDCTEYEKRIIYDIIRSTKESLRQNKHYLKSMKK